MSDELFSVAGQVVLVSGGSRGIGRSLAEGFAQRGAKVIVTGREQATIDVTAKELSASAQHPVRGFVCDVAKPDAVRQLTADVVAAYGHIDTLLNVAGVNIRKKAETYTEEEYDYILDINLKGAFFLSQEVGKAMIARGQGGNIVSIDSLNSDKPLKAVLPYALSKAGISSMTASLAMEWGEHGIRVNAVAPGFILTDLTRKLWSLPTMQEWGQANTPLKRLGEVEDLVGTTLFLASRASAYITGQVIYVDGGLIAGRMWPIPT